MFAFLPSPSPILGPNFNPFIQYQTTHTTRPCTTYRMPKAQIFCRMRNRGGFRPPPKIPSDAADLQRAIELLGALTQHKGLKTSRKEELERLIGLLPTNRKVAQQWKAALQRPTNPRKRHLSHPTSFKNRKRLLDTIRLPHTNATVGRCFVLLGCLQRRHRLSQPVTQTVLDELTRYLGSAPADEKETHHYIKALWQLQRKRRSIELHPPQIPVDDIQELEYARMLLGTFAVKGAVGKQAPRLERFLGTLPRNKNVAASWKKLVEAAIRKKNRRERAARKREEIHLKRLQRRLKRQKQEAEAAHASTFNRSLDDAIGGVRHHVLPSPQCLVLAPPLYGRQQHQITPFIGLLWSLFGRIFRLHP